MFMANKQVKAKKKLEGLFSDIDTVIELCKDAGMSAKAAYWEAAKAAMEDAVATAATSGLSFVLKPP